MPLKSKRAPRRRRQYRRRRAPMYRRMRNHIVEKASAQYSTTSQPLFPNGSVYSFRNFSLSGASSRVQSVAQAYQFYRIKRVTWEVRPAYDTFAPTGTTPTSVPQLYWCMDKEATFTTKTSLQTLKAAGCKPIRLDDKMIRKSFKPAVLQAVADQAGTAAGPHLVLGSKRISPWLPTNFLAYAGNDEDTWTPSSIDHHGLLICIDQDSGALTTTPCAYMSFTVEFEFKKPLDISALGEPDGFVEVDTLTLKPGYVPPAELLKTTL